MSESRVGTCGFCMRHAACFGAFDILEAQRTFYDPPQRETAERWREEAGEDVEFTIKAFQAMTHPPSSPTYRRSKLSDEEKAQCGGFRDTDVVRRGGEPRGDDWTQDLVRDVCRDLDLIHVTDPFDRRAMCGAPRYYRLHGMTGYRHEYSDAEFEQLRGFCDTEASRVLFHNASMAEDAQRFASMVGAGTR